MKINNLPGPFGAEITDVDVTSCSDDDLKMILSTVYDRRLAVIRTNALTDDAFVRFGYRAGKPLPYDESADQPEIFHITNISSAEVEDNTTAEHWHSDMSFTEIRPTFTILYSVSAPEKGGSTKFCDLAAAYDALPESTKNEIDGLMVEHQHRYTNVHREDRTHRLAPDGWNDSATVIHPLVRAHPITGQKTLFAISGTPVGIQNMDRDEGEKLLQKLRDHALQDRFLTSYQHRTNDLVIWDNPTTLHCATAIQPATGPHDARIIRRMSLVGTPSVFKQ